jgi:hypothetical protein
VYHNTRGIARHFSLLRFSAGEVKKGPKPAPLSGRKVTLERRRNIGKEPDTAIPLVQVSRNTNFHHFLLAANQADTGDREKAH